jgi:hypothetical protein
VMARGVRCRSIVAPGELNSPEIYAELEAAHARGESLRTHPNIPTRLQIYDRKLAVLRVDPTDLRRGAMFVRAQALVDALVETFEMMWTTATPVFTSTTGANAPAGRRARVLELLALGTKDVVIARTLGVSTRTIGRDVADLKADLGVSSRAEIPAAAVRKAWL